MLACIPVSLVWPHCWEGTSQIVGPGLPDLAAPEFAVQSTTIQWAPTITQHRASFHKACSRNILPSSIYLTIFITECLLCAWYCLKVWERETIIPIKATKTFILEDTVVCPDLPSMKYLCPRGWECSQQMAFICQLLLDCLTPGPAPSQASHIQWLMTTGVGKPGHPSSTHKGSWSSEDPHGLPFCLAAAWLLPLLHHASPPFLLQVLKPNAHFHKHQAY